MAKGSQDRRKRIPFGVPRQKGSIDRATETRLIASGKIPRWVNEENLTRAIEGGYEFVSPDGGMEVGGGKEAQERDRRIRQQTGKNKDGSTQYRYFMAIDKKLYDEDQQAKEDINKQVDVAIRGGNPSGLTPHGVRPEHGGATLENVQYQP